MSSNNKNNNNNNNNRNTRRDHRPHRRHIEEDEKEADEEDNNYEKYDKRRSYKKRSRYTSEYDNDNDNDEYYNEKKSSDKKSKDTNDDDDDTGDGLSEMERKELERKARMARLRAENEEEERRLAALDSIATGNTPSTLSYAGTGSSNTDYHLHTSSTSSSTSSSNKKNNSDIHYYDPKELDGLEEEEQMMKLLGFSGSFHSTKGKAVEDNLITAARGATSKNKARKYRQYMNRRGGFNRPLDKMP